MVLILSVKVNFISSSLNKLIFFDCFQNDDNALQVRLAALSATRRLPCNLQDQMAFLEKVFLRRSLDSELRIAAYLAAMQCPSASTLSIIRDSLYRDDVNQGNIYLLLKLAIYLSNKYSYGDFVNWFSCQDFGVL